MFQDNLVFACLIAMFHELEGADYEKYGEKGVDANVEGKTPHHPLQECERDYCHPSALQLLRDKSRVWTCLDKPRSDLIVAIILRLDLLRVLT